MEQFSLNNPCFLNLLSSQSSQVIDLDFPDVITFSTQTSKQHKAVQNRQWTQTEDVVLISASLNTSKDPIVGNQQRLSSFWNRIMVYFNSSPEVSRSAPREQSQIKEQWRKLNEQVCKFVGSYEAALKAQSSGQNENDVMTAAHDIFVNDYKAGFNLEHAWRLLKFNQKWLSTNLVKEGAKDKAKEAVEPVSEEVESEARLSGVKAAKATKRKNNGNEAALDQLHSISRQKILSTLLAKSKSELFELEVSLKSKLLAEML